MISTGMTFLAFIVKKSWTLGGSFVGASRFVRNEKHLKSWFKLDCEGDHPNNCNANILGSSASHHYSCYRSFSLFIIVPFQDFLRIVFSCVRSFLNIQRCWLRSNRDPSCVSQQTKLFDWCPDRRSPLSPSSSLWHTGYLGDPCLSPAP